MAIAPAPCTYQRRRPELTPCYRIIQEHLGTFIAAREAEGRPLPDYISAEFDAYLKCGIPAHGFIRLVGEVCQQEKIAAFSCKRGGFCPSCCAKRMAEAATHLTDHVLLIYTRYGELARFRNLDPITDDEVAGLIQTISSKVLALCVRRGYLSRDGERSPTRILTHSFKTTLHPEVKKGFQFRDDDDDSDVQPLRNYTWSKMLAKVFKIDVTTCDACGGPMKKISAMTDPMQVRRYLKHENIDYEPPARAPPRYQPGEFDFDDSQYHPAEGPLST